MFKIHEPKYMPTRILSVIPFLSCEAKHLQTVNVRDEKTHFNSYSLIMYIIYFIHMPQNRLAIALSCIYLYLLQPCDCFTFPKSIEYRYHNSILVDRYILIYDPGYIL